MRKLFVLFLPVVLLSLVAIYFFIPDTITIYKKVYVNCNIDGAARVLLQTAQWKKWWLNNDSSANSSFSISENTFVYKQTTYKINTFLHNSVDLCVGKENSETNSTLQFFPINSDSIVIIWQTNLSLSQHPFKKLQQYARAFSIKKDISDVLLHLQSFLAHKDNVYGISIQKTSTIDTVLVATKAISTTYPSKKLIYDAVDVLAAFITKKGAHQTGAPMLNVSKIDANQYQYMVAVPTNLPLPDEGNIFFRKMIRGDFLVTEVKGGVVAVNNAMTSMENYIADYRKTVMAIPFQSLVTDRRKETDSTRWITKIYFPIYY